jgi:hypothetical protein
VAVNRKLLYLPCLLIISALALSACGGGGDSDESKIEDAIETSATSNEPSNCTELQTQKFDEQNSGTQGAAAVADCEREAEEGEDQAESVEVSAVAVDGDAATAAVAFSGSGLDDQAVEVALVKDGDDWKLDEIVKFTEFDSQKLAEAFEEQFAGSELDPQISTCLTEAIGSAAQSEAEELMFSGSEQPIEELVAECE